MAQLSTIISSILRDMVVAQHQANMYAANLEDVYRNGNLKQFAMPGVALGEIEMELRYGVEDDSVEKLQTEIDYPELRKYSQDISSQLAMAILESVMPILQSEFLDKNASEDEEAHFLVELTDKPELMQKYRAFLGRKILTAIRDKNTALINDDGTVNSKILKDCVMRTCQEELLHHAEMENLFNRTGGGLVRKQALATLEAKLDETIPKILENVNLKRKRLFPSVDVTVNSENLASLPEECIHTLKFRVSPNNIKLYTEDEES